MSYPIYVIYWPDDWPHAHLVLIADGSVPATEAWPKVRANLEGYASELAEQILQCDEDRHGGRGRTHTLEDAKKAFISAVEQIVTKDYAADWAELERNIALHKKWGGTVPQAVLSFHPDDPKKETLMLLNKQGNPVWYNVKPKILREVMPRPDQDQSAVKHPTGLGWVTRPHWSAERRLRWLKRRNNLN